MSNRFLILLVCVFPFCFSCNKSNNALFEINTFGDFTVNAGLSTIETHYYYIDNVFIPLESSAAASGADLADINQVVANRAVLSPKFDETLDLDYINSVDVYAISKSDFTDRKEIFYMDIVPLGDKNRINLFSTIENLTDLFKDDRVIIEIQLDFRQFPPATTEFRLDMSFSAFASE